MLNPSIFRFNSVRDLVNLTTITFGMDNCFDRSVAFDFILMGYCVATARGALQ
jgi:hypothetical protein